jgi:hypothetical protein
MVSKWWKRQGRSFARAGAHQSKIYVESNHAHFLRIFAALISTQTPAIYRRLLVREAIARDQAQRDQTDG